jgi:PIN domain nuclease of toxin-antitoxin system
VRLLLDTQAMWWLLAEPERLRRDAYTILGDSAARLHYSPLNILELAIKRTKGKFAYADGTLFKGIESWGIREVPVRRQHAVRAGSLPYHHGDPFDRLLVAQAVEEDLLLVSSDRTMMRYEVRILPA